MNCILCGARVLEDEHAEPFGSGVLCECCMDESLRTIEREGLSAKDPEKDLIGLSYRRWLAKELGYDK